MQLAAMILSAISLVLITVVLVIQLMPKKDGQSELRMEISNSLQAFGKTISDNQRTASEAQDKRLSGMEQNNALDFERLRHSQEDRIRSLEQSNDQKLEAIRQTMERRLTSIQSENAEKLEKMQQVVDEKLQKTLESRISESFKRVSDQLEQVYKGLGEMQNVASGVNDLKKVLSNVKTRGILGEAQLSAILSEILAPEQYDVDVATNPARAIAWSLRSVSPATERTPCICRSTQSSRVKHSPLCRMHMNKGIRTRSHRLPRCLKSV